MPRATLAPHPTFAGAKQLLAKDLQVFLVQRKQPDRGQVQVQVQEQAQAQAQGQQSEL